MPKQQDDASKTLEHRNDSASSQRSDLSTSRTVPPWQGLVEVRGGLFRLWGDGPVIVAILTLVGFVVLALEGFPFEVRVFEALLGILLVSLARRPNAKP
jgi:hypothetical protein